MKRAGFEKMSPYRYPFYIMFHPKDGFFEMKTNKKESAVGAFVIIMMWLLVELLYRTMTGFDLNPYVGEKVSLLRVSVITIMVFVMVCVSNWCFCTLLDGKGKLKNICIVGAYSLLPYIIVRFLTILLSQIMTQGEQIFLDYSVILAEVWCFCLAFCGLQEIQEYSFKKTLLSIGLTLVGVIIMLFVVLLVVMLFQQVYYFAATIIFELKYS